MKLDLDTAIIAVLMVLVILALMVLTAVLMIKAETEEIRAEMETLQEREAERYNDLDARLKVLEEVANETHS